MLDFFTDFKYNGRFVNVEVSEDTGRSSRSRKGNNRGRRRNDDRPRSERGTRRNRNSDTKRNKKNFKGTDRPRRNRRK